MFDNLKDKLRHINFHRPAKTQKPSDDGGSLYKLWLLVLPLLVGIAAGSLFSAGIGYVFDYFASPAGITDAAVSGVQASSEDSDRTRGLDGFLEANPFHISAQKTDTPTPAPKAEEEVKPQPQPSTLDDVILRGTLPGVGGWFEQKGELKLVLVGKNIERYRLASVQYNEAVFRRGNQSIKKYITYGPVESQKKEEAPKAAASRLKPINDSPKQTGNITAASANSEGSVPAEMVNSLVQNPFDELKRIRVRPNDKAGGLEVQWIQNDSILKRLGVQRGDVIKSVNGIPFTNMGDIANSINSLMNSERFDVEVTRGGKATALRYVVR